MKNIFITLLILTILAVAGYFGYKYFYPKSSGTACTMEAKICPDGTSVRRTGPKCEFAECPSPNATSQNGVVSGKLCFPSSFLPPGEIVAKNLISKELITQNYPGSMAGGKSTYSIELLPGTYHLRYQAHGSTSKPDIFTSGYYDECAKTMHTNECTPDSGHVQITVEVKAKGKVENVDLCDFYYNPTQMESLDNSF